MIILWNLQKETKIETSYWPDKIVTYQKYFKFVPAQWLLIE